MPGRADRRGVNVSSIYDSIMSLHAKLPYAYGGGHAFRPLRVQLELTGACNLKCDFCFQGDDYKYGRDEMDFRKIAAIIDQIPRFTLLTFSGGEPLLRKDIRAIIDYALDKKHYCNMSTNGVLLKKDIVETMVGKGFLVVSVSLDGIGKVHDDLRGVPGTFEKVRDNLTRLTEHKRKEKKRLPLLDIKTVITNKNIDNLVELYRFCEEVGADFFTLSLLKRNQVQFNPSPLKDDIEDACFYQKGTSYPLENDKLLIELERLEGVGGKTKLRFYPRFGSIGEFKNFLKKGGNESAHERRPCMEPWSSFQINASGRAYPCLSYCVGNIKEQTVKEMWGSERFLSFRRRLKEMKLFPACDGCCYLKIKA